MCIRDRLKKIGPEGVKEELRQKGLDDNLLEQIQSKKPTEWIQILLNNKETISSNLEYEPTLARGLDYYTGIIIEVEIEGFDAGSVGGGGRYDNLIGMFSSNDMPAVGFAFGFDRLMEAMEEKNLFPQLTTTKVLVTVPSSEIEDVVWNIGILLRSKDINTETYLNAIPMEKQFRYAEKKNIPYVVVPLNENEVELRTKNEDGSINKQTLTLEQLIEKLQ